jgi:hypothetical protein
MEELPSVNKKSGNGKRRTPVSSRLLMVVLNE